MFTSTCFGWGSGLRLGTGNGSGVGEGIVGCLSGFSSGEMRV
jgi:hypothetical protein